MNLSRAEGTSARHPTAADRMLDDAHGSEDSVWDWHEQEAELTRIVERQRLADPDRPANVHSMQELALSYVKKVLKAKHQSDREADAA